MHPYSVNLNNKEPFKDLELNTKLFYSHVETRIIKNAGENHFIFDLAKDLNSDGTSNNKQRPVKIALDGDNLVISGKRKNLIITPNTAKNFVNNIDKIINKEVKKIKTEQLLRANITERSLALVKNPLQFNKNG